ncbi:uncharacterized protein LOC129719515 [Wyeomyia smithii]|uniref:uncharacterized protein LOC129719515 n=1 Tax=Wyeomyia smithii TaxID=174621 RepID=UPI002467D151|nr:uncharacterized protein LOC129719515 [Wyeomyia smithii]
MHPACRKSTLLGARSSWCVGANSYPVLASSLDPVTRKHWEATIVRGVLPKYNGIIAFPKKQCDILENCETSNQLASPRERQPSVKTVVQPRSNTKILAASSNSGNASSEECDICGESHKNFECGLLKNLSVSERVEKARSLGFCFNCLRKGHRLRDCLSDRKCMKSRQRHHTQLYDDARVKPDQTDSKKKEVPDKPVPVSTPVYSEAQAGLSSGSASTVTSTCSVQAAPTKKNVLLLTAVVNVFDRQGKPYLCRILLDCGSQVNLITKSMADAIATRISPANVKISGVNNRTTSSLEKTVVKIHSRYSDYQATVECIITPTVTGPIPNTEIDVSDWHISPGFQLADPEFNCPQDIDMLIGNGLFFKLLKSGQYRLAEHLPELRDTHLGWVFTGEYEEVGNHGPSYSHTVTVEDVYDAVQRFWHIEEVPDQEAKSTEAEECEKHFLSTHKRTKEGRFVVQLPLKENANQLSDCRSLALKRFYLLEQRFARDPCLREQYVDFIREYERLGHCKQIDERKDPPNMLKCHLPHHAVIRPDSSSTKCQVVFDASSKPSKSGISLNEVLKVGGNVQSDTFDIVLRFRKPKFAFTADISKMYRQILVDPMHLALQRIFWRESPEKSMKVYELTTVTYGTASAPFLATQCLKQLAGDGKLEYPLGAATVIEDFYVDDVLSGDDTLKGAIERQAQVKKLLATAGFSIHKWCSNSEQLLEHIPEEEREEMKNLEEQGVNEVIKVLVIVLAKLLMQQLWKSKMSWDEPVEKAISAQWMLIKKTLVFTNQVRIPRHVLTDKAGYELHGFADASMATYGACIYIRSVLQDDSAKLQLVCSKSKVAPLEQSTIPRLELCAARLLSHLVPKVIRALKMRFKRVVLWSDSQIVLAWMHKSPDQLQVFVRNRIIEIRSVTKEYEWMYVRSEFNPADIVSRGQMPSELVKNKLWWYGPDFLSSVQFEQEVVEEITDEELPELRSVAAVVLPATEEDELKVFSKYSSFRKIQRVIALVLRFVRNCKKKDPATRVTESIPTVQELRCAMEVIVKVVQRQEFGDEVARVETRKPCRRLGSLSPILVNGVLRLGGHYRSASCPAS